MEIAGKLIGHDIDHNALLNKMMEKNQKLLHQGYVLQHFELMDDGFCQVKITEDVLEQFGISQMKHLSLLIQLLTSKV